MNEPSHTTFTNHGSHPKPQATSLSWRALMLWVKAFHIIFMVCWFSGIFYLPRLFVYHTQIAADAEVEQARIKIMERKLYRFVSPLMWLMIGFGFWLIFINGWDWFSLQTWLQIKLVLVTILSSILCVQKDNDL